MRYGEFLKPISYRLMLSIKKSMEEMPELVKKGDEERIKMHIDWINYFIEEFLDPEIAFMDYFDKDDWPQTPEEVRAENEYYDSLDAQGIRAEIEAEILNTKYD